MCACGHGVRLRRWTWRADNQQEDDERDVVEGHDGSDAGAKVEAFARSSDAQQVIRSDAARFQGVPRKAVQAMVESAPKIIAVMPTGESQSLLFRLPARISLGGLEVVVVWTAVSRHGSIVSRCGLVVSRYDSIVQSAAISLRAQKREAE